MPSHRFILLLFLLLFHSYPQTSTAKIIRSVYLLFLFSATKVLLIFSHFLTAHFSAHHCQNNMWYLGFCFTKHFLPWSFFAFFISVNHLFTFLSLESFSSYANPLSSSSSSSPIINLHRFRKNTVKVGKQILKKKLKRREIKKVRKEKICWRTFRDFWSLLDRSLLTGSSQESLSISGSLIYFSFFCLKSLSHL